MNFQLNEEQLLLRQDVIDFSKSKLSTMPDKEVFNEDIWKQIAEFGLLGLTVSEEYGGAGESYTTAAAVFEALGYAFDNNGMIFSINNHIWVAQNTIFNYGSKTLREKYVRQMVAGKQIGAIAISEAEAGSDAFGMTTGAVKDGDSYVLNGTKAFISNGPIADIFIVLAVTHGGSPKRLTAFVVEKTFDGVSIGPNIEKMGLGGCPTSEVTFKNCIVPAENIIGILDMGSSILLATLEWERCFEFVPHIGRMRHLMELCIRYANTRRQFNRTIGEYQAVSHKIADMRVSIEMAENLLYKIVQLKDGRKSAYLESCIFKLYVSERYIQTCKDAIQIFGGYGYTKEYQIERELRDAIASSIYSGTNELQKNSIYDMSKSEAYF